MKAFRLLLYFVLGLALGTASALSFAGTFTSYQGSAFRNINGTMYWKGDATSFAASQARVFESVAVGGTYIAVPHVGSLGAAAMQAAITGLRSTPGAMLTTAAASWLLGQGLEYLNGQWMKKDSSSLPIPGEWRYGHNLQAGPFSSPAAACAHFDANSRVGPASMAVVDTPGSENGCYYPSATRLTGLTNGGNQPCPAGYHVELNACVKDSPYVPAGDSDWDQVRGVTPPDAVMADLCRRLAALGSGCALSSGNTEKASVPLSDWKTDPLTGTQSRETATWNPSPSASDPFRGEINVEKETKTTTTTTDPNTGQPVTTETTTSDDKTDKTPLCSLYPDILACAKFGEATDPDKLDQTKQVSITPDTGFGPQDGTCPADLTYTVHLTGTQLRFSYQPVCTGLRTFRPVIIGMAWVSGVLIFLGIARKAQG